MHKGPDQTRLGLGQLRAVAGIDGNVAECSSAIVLNIDIGRRKELDKDGDGAGIDELLAVVIWKRVS